MACLIKKGNVYSPESTVSSLLASCSLSSSNSSLNSPSSIQYKDKLYRSASQALEAYIEDFDLSRVSQDTQLGKICITQGTPKDFRSSKDGFKHTSALKNVKQHIIPGSVGPRFRRKTAYDPDMLSVTTDDLLAFPADGSVSLTHTAVLRPATQRSKQNKKPLTAFSSHARHWTSSLGNEEEMNFPKNVSSVHKDSCRKERAQHKYQDAGVSGFSLKDQLAKQENWTSACYKNYPRWLTSHKSDLSVSGISSVPDFKYPIWLKSHDLLSESANESFAQSDPVPLSEHRMPTKQNADISNHSGSSGHNSLLDLQNKSDVQRNVRQYDDLSVYSVSKILRESEHQFGGDGTELILQKAKRTLEMSVEELTSALKNDGSPNTVDVLEAERSWDNVPIGLKSPVRIYCQEEDPLQTPKASIVNEFLEDCLKNSSQESTFSGGNHHGPVEALKLMLFNLQAVQQTFNQNKMAGHSEEFKKTSEDAVEYKLCDCDTIPVTQSLHRALHHLSRLKGLVEDTGGKKDSEDVIQT
ncbi:hypothetical protein lerEdw1_010793 [Lerista edwardsae]|nr:hypothetical protein lerEdw1_010793 [Lerista edwardsae]